MIDIHSHIVFDVDDGSDSIEESIRIIRKAQERGIKAMFATPHFIEGSMTAEANEVKEKVGLLRERLMAENITMPIYTGHEIYLDFDSLIHLRKGKSLTLNNTRYVLVELPMQDKLRNLDEMLFEFTVRGFTPIIAHPERYAYVQKDLDIVKRWIELGVLTQINLSTLYGRYGEVVKKTAIKMLKRQMYHLVGTDVHSSQSTALSVAAPLGRMKEIVGDDIYDEIVHQNPQKLIENRLINPFEVIPVKRPIFELFKKR
ncbi:MAG: hypothetical protein JEZ08_17995 [Clostridiales bacterium]|nr:hypothetical protein [Clostridiales bacterium]